MLTTAYIVPRSIMRLCRSRFLFGRYSLVKVLTAVTVLSLFVAVTLLYSYISEESASSDNRRRLQVHLHPKQRRILDPWAPVQHMAAGKVKNNVSADQAIKRLMTKLNPASYRLKQLMKFSRPNPLRNADHMVKDIQRDNPVFNSRIEDYCNIPQVPVTGQEGEVPAGYQLKMVYIVIRHGDRSPMYSFLHHPNPSLSCQFDQTLVKGIPKLTAYVPTMRVFEGKQNVGSGFKSWALYPSHRICDNSQLTGIGALQHLFNGMHLNQIYVHKWQLFGKSFSSDEVYVRSTEYSRTYQSAIALLYAFLPRFNLTELNIQRSQSVFFCSEKAIGNSCACPVIRHLKKISDMEGGLANRNNTELKKLQKIIADVFNLQRNQLPWMWAMLDVFMAYACHDVKWPCNKKGRCITTSHISSLWGHLDKQGTRLENLRSYNKYTRLALHPLLSEITDHMLQVTKNKSPVKFMMFSGHDTTVGPLASSLGFNEGKWPKLATRIIIELYSRQDNKSHHYLRFLFNGKDVTSKVRFCKGLLKHGLCKLNHFVNYVKEENLKEFGVKKYRAACRDSKK